MGSTVRPMPVPALLPLNGRYPLASGEGLRGGDLRLGGCEGNSLPGGSRGR